MSFSSQIQLSEEDLASFKSIDENDLLRLLVQYPEITQVAFKTMEPATITAYLVNVTGQLESCFEDQEVGITLTPAQATLYETTQIVLKSGMKLLGINPLT